MKSHAKTGPIPVLLRHFPLYVWICVVAMLSVQMLVYCGTRLFLPYLTPHVLTTRLDDAIPFVQEWVVIYFLAFITWLVNALLILREGKRHAYRFACAYILALLISAAVFLLYPGTMARPVITGNGLFPAWMRFLYWIDSPTNLCPSLHVLISYYCWRGTFGCQSIPKWYQRCSLLFLILVCCSILFVKQHALVDIPAALLVGEAALQLARVWRLERIPFALENACSKKKEAP